MILLERMVSLASYFEQLVEEEFVGRALKLYGLLICRLDFEGKIVAYNQRINL